MSNPSENPTEELVPRNAPCPCGSGKKYKRCHGTESAPVLTKAVSENPAMPAGFDPSTLDQGMMKQMQEMLQKLPPGQMQKLQSLMQRAMSGKDVSTEAEEFSKHLPMDLQQMMGQMSDQIPDNVLPAQGGAVTEDERSKKSSLWGRWFKRSKT